MDAPPSYRWLLSPKQMLLAFTIGVGLFLVYAGAVDWPVWRQRVHEMQEKHDALVKMPLDLTLTEAQMKRIMDEAMSGLPSTVPTEPEEKEEAEAGATGTDDPPSAP